MNWELRLRKKDKKIIHRFPKKEQIRIIQALRELVFDPYTGDVEKIKGEKNSWRRRVGAYRIFYEIYPQQKVIYVFRVECRTSKTY